MSSIVPGAGFDDLQPLRRILQGVRVVGIGEATHGTREFVQLRHRLLEFLVREMGFTVLAVEFSAADAVLINDYILHGQARREQVAACLQKLWITDTEEMTAVVDWMREYNGRAPIAKRVKFLGIDPQVNDHAIDVVKDYLRKTAPERVAKTENLFGVLSVEDAHARKFAPTSVPPEQLAELYKLISYLVLHRSNLVRQSSAAEWDLALQHLRWLTQFAEFNSPAPVDGGGMRDGYMAENFLNAVSKEGPETRCVLWAHNAHVCKRDTGSFPALGSFLRKALGNDYFVFGIAFDRGSFLAQVPRVQPPKQEVFTLNSAPARTIDWYLARVGMDHFLVDLRAPARTRGSPRG